MRSPRGISGLFTLALMSWAAVWCCCVPAAAVRHARSCCERPADDGRRTCPADDSDHCPIVQAREQSVAPTLPVVPDAVAFAVPLPTWLTLEMRTPSPVSCVTADRIRAATDPPTLLDLHTSLVT